MRRLLIIAITFFIGSAVCVTFPATVFAQDGERAATGANNARQGQNGVNPQTSNMPATQTETDEAIERSGGNPGPELTPFVPRLSVPIAGVQFTTPTMNGPYVEVPFLAQYITGIYRYVLGIVTIVAIIMVIYGGFKYLLSGTVKGVSDGKEILKDVVAGMAVLFCAYVFLYFINPKLVQLPVLRIRSVASVPIPPESSDESAARDAGEGAVGADGRGPATYCRENLVPRPHQGTGTVWCAACGGGCSVIETGRPDHVCQALVGQCGGAFGAFLKALTDNCQSKTFGWLETLDGGTFGIMHYISTNVDGLMTRLQRRDAAAYGRVMAAANGQQPTEQAICASQRNDRGFICNPGYRAMITTALRERSFTLVQLEDAFDKYNRRAQIARSYQFTSAYGQAMWAVMLNNPGACGGSLAPLRAACTQTDESARIDCFLRKFAEVPCRGSADGARNRVTSMTNHLSGLSRSSGSAPVTLQQLEACVP